MSSQKRLVQEEFQKSTIFPYSFLEDVFSAEEIFVPIEIWKNYNETTDFQITLTTLLNYQELDYDNQFVWVTKFYSIYSTVCPNMTILP